MPATTPFSYNPQSPTDQDMVRMLIPDTTNTADEPAFFNDYEIQNLFTVQRRVYQSSMFFSGSQGANLPQSSFVSLLRVAAIGIDILANNSAQVGIISKLLDVTLKDASRMLGDRADKYRQIDDESGAFAIVEQCSTVWATRDRWWRQIQRMSGGGGL